jgi:hypothetical protein
MPSKQRQQVLKVKHTSSESINAIDNKATNLARFNRRYKLRQLWPIDRFAGVPFVGEHMSNAPVFTRGELPTHIDLALTRTISDTSNA